MQVGGASPEVFATVRRVQHAFLSRPGGSLVLTSARGNLGISAVAREMRRSFAPRGGVARQGDLAAAGMSVNSNDVDNVAAWIARRKVKRETEYQLLPKSPSKDMPKSDHAPPSPSTRKVHRPPYSSISMEPPAHAQEMGSSAREDLGGNRGQSASVALELGGQFTPMGADVAAFPDTASDGNLARYTWPGRRKNISERRGMSRAETYHACAPFKFADGRLGKVRCAPDISVGIACSRGRYTASELEADIRHCYATAI